MGTVVPFYLTLKLLLRDLCEGDKVGLVLWFLDEGLVVVDPIQSKSSPLSTFVPTFDLPLVQSPSVKGVRHRRVSSYVHPTPLSRSETSI